MLAQSGSDVALQITLVVLIVIAVLSIALVLVVRASERRSRHLDEQRFDAPQSDEGDSGRRAS